VTYELERTVQREGPRYRSGVKEVWEKRGKEYERNEGRKKTRN
jgi:hypothetical protein